jgi:hypothetical protein
MKLLSVFQGKKTEVAKKEDVVKLKRVDDKTSPAQTPKLEPNMVDAILLHQEETWTKTAEARAKRLAAELEAEWLELELSNVRNVNKGESCHVPKRQK